ncbi:MAG TPA: hypothetical protein VEF04_04590 [Blastocatellia bacterium]|nr:hypothetical protein [Blastocatellia bacterium]
MPKEDKQTALAKLDAHVEAVTQQQIAEKAYEVMGAIKALNSLTENLGAQVMRALMRFRDEKLYENYGYGRFDDYLDKHPTSPMSYATFNRREKLLESEGDDIYNLLESIQVPMTTRKALPPDSFEVRDNVLIVADDKGKEYEVPLTDTKRIKNIINNIAREHRDAKKKLTDETKKTEALTNRIKELSESKPASSELSTPHGEALLFVITALQNLIDKANDLSDAEVIEARGNAMELIGAKMSELHQAYRFDIQHPGKVKSRKAAKEPEVADADIVAALGQ